MNKSFVFVREGGVSVISELPSYHLSKGPLDFFIPIRHSLKKNVRFCTILSRPMCTVPCWAHSTGKLCCPPLKSCFRSGSTTACLSRLTQLTRQTTSKLPRPLQTSPQTPPLQQPPQSPTVSHRPLLTRAVNGHYSRADSAAAGRDGQTVHITGIFSKETFVDRPAGTASVAGQSSGDSDQVQYEFGQFGRQQCQCAVRGAAQSAESQRTPSAAYQSGLHGLWKADDAEIAGQII